MIVGYINSNKKNVDVTVWRQVISGYYKLRRKICCYNSNYIWSGKENEIKQKLLSGITRKQEALDTGMSICSLYNYINQTPELKKILRERPNEQ